MEYNIHYLQVVSPVEQEVWVSAYTYEKKHYHGACGTFFDRSDASEILYGAPESTMLQVINPGSFHDESRMMNAGEALTYTMYTRFSDEDLLPHDWSLAAWASDEAVQINYVDPNGMRSDRFKSTTFTVQSLYVDEDLAAMIFSASALAASLVSLFI